MNLQLFSKKKLLLAFEYGLILSETARLNNIELTPEIVKRCEDMLINEFKSKNPTKLSLETHANILSIFETDAGNTM